jgi:hypothetical protein
MLLCKRTNRCYLIVTSLYGFRPTTAEQLRLHPDREKLCVEISGFRAHCNEVPVSELLLNIDVFIQQSLRGVDVHIDYDSASMNGERVGGRRLRQGCILIVVIHLFASAARKRQE